MIFCMLVLLQRVFEYYEKCNIDKMYYYYYYNSADINEIYFKNHYYIISIVFCSAHEV